MSGWELCRRPRLSCGAGVGPGEKHPLSGLVPSPRTKNAPGAPGASSFWWDQPVPVDLATPSPSRDGWRLLSSPPTPGETFPAAADQLLGRQVRLVDPLPFGGVTSLRYVFELDAAL